MERSTFSASVRFIPLLGAAAALLPPSPALAAAVGGPAADGRAAPPPPAWHLAPAGAGGTSPRVYYDYATVVSVRELFEASAPAPYRAREETCRQTLAAGGGILSMGAPRPREGASIAGAILAELEALDDCVAAAAEPPSRTAGFEVTYRYGGRLYRRVMMQPPGERIRVRVELAAHAR